MEHFIGCTPHATPTPSLIDWGYHGDAVPTAAQTQKHFDQCQQPLAADRRNSKLRSRRQLRTVLKDHSKQKPRRRGASSQICINQFVRQKLKTAPQNWN